MKFLCCVIYLICCTEGFCSNWKIDIEASKIKWTGKKLSGQHWGHVKIKEGYVIIQKNRPINSKIVVDMNTITCEDLTDVKYNQKLLTHLKSEDFFSTSKYPYSQIILKKIEDKGENLKIQADLTIKGKTQSIEFLTIKSIGDKLATFKAKLIFDRTKYGIKYNSGNFFKSLGDKLIKDDVELDVTLIAKNQH
ncbi:MAG: YceI family protein [Halobacteriovoraceae bacterium]|nr:YceI family protein [Halobacteriovoraceae bacterium]